jgi:membrane protein YdbS with pleckstrin-like domain
VKPWKKNLLVAFAIMVLIIWAIEFFIYSVGAIIHTLLIVSAVMLFIRFKRWKNRRKEIRDERGRIQE